MFGTIHYGHDFWRFRSHEIVQEPSNQINWAEEFHVYSVLWTEQCIRFQVDGVDMYYIDPATGEPVLEVGPSISRSTLQSDPRGATTWPFDQDFHMILNIAVGGNLPGDPGFNTTWPQTMEVDYVRVYQ
jgi:beta-glucanase (GH16 family)